jgi:branched-chain amino acid aminotransferase
MSVWIDGRFVEEPGSIAADDRGFLLGDGVFETLLVVDGKPAFLDRHLERMRAGLALLRIDASPQTRDVPATIAELALRNRASQGQAAVRITVTRGPGTRGLGLPPPEEQRPAMVVSMARTAPASSTPALLLIAATVRSEQSVAARAKTLGYLDNVLAHDEAVRAGADEALMLNSRGRLACASAANVFVIATDGAVVTPPPSEGALPGIVRAVLVDHGHAAGIAIEERPIATDELVEAAAIVLTNSLIGVRAGRLTAAQAATGPDDEGPYSNETLHALRTVYARALAADLASRTTPVRR